MTGLQAPLDRILLLQTLLPVAPGMRVIGELCCGTLASMPGVAAVALRSAEDEVLAVADASGLLAQRDYPARDEAAVIVPLVTLQTDYGALEFTLSQPTEFEHIKPYVENTASLAALVLESSDRATALERANEHLEAQVKQRSAGLEASERRFRTMIEHAPEAIVLCDPTTLRFDAANENALVLFKCDRDPLLSSDLLERSPLLQADERPSAEVMAGHVAEAMRGGVSAFDWLLTRSDGVSLPCEVRLVRLEFDDGVVLRGSITDVSERRQLEAQLFQAQKMEAVGQLSGGLAHDFNNLLTAIMGYAELLQLRQEQSPATRAEMLENIITSAERGAELSNRLLAFSRRQNLRPVSVRIDELTAGMAGLLRRTIGEPFLIDFQTDPDLGACRADHGQVENALLNLVLNARDAMPEGGILTISTRNADLSDSGAARLADVEPGHYVSLCVRDTGVGMSSEVRTRSTEPFFTTKEQGKGTGLGLSMVYGFAQQSEGSLLIESELGVGTTITLLLPRDAEGTTEQEPATPSGEQPEELPAAHPGERILLVEDDVPLRSMLREQLEQLGYEVQTAGTAQQALDCLTRHGGFDAMLTDIIMPGQMNGKELADLALQRFSGLGVLLMSGYTHEALDIESCPSDSTHSDCSGGPGQACACYRLLQKPFMREELARALRITLDTRAAQPG